ncbi:MAG: L-2-hydroxyglutarate oxidase [Verrucomicrobiales bacterium]
MKKKVAIIGGGIVGLATAYKLSQSQQLPGLKITIFEKELEPGRHQSTHNSGVLHCGLYYKPGSYKARLAVTGIREMTAFCQDHEIPHEICGKLVVATDGVEEERLRKLEKRGAANGLKGLKWMDADEMRKREPNVAGVAAIEVPEEGIVDYKAVCEALSSCCRERGVEIKFGEAICEFEEPENGSGSWILRSSEGEFEADFVINCAGLHCDRICKKSGSKPGLQIVPFRGEYFKLKPESQEMVKHLIYPVPDPNYPFLGVHFTRMIGGGIEAGPNAVLAFAREGYRKRDINLRDLAGSLSFIGLHRFLFKNWKMCFGELAQSFSRKRFCTALQKLVPDIQKNDLETGGAGVRAQAMGRDGSLADDFVIVQKSNALHLLNAPSPGATASLAIGSEIVGMVEGSLN